MRTFGYIIPVHILFFTVWIAFAPHATSAAPDESQPPALRAGSGLESTQQGRDWLKYIVRCAMPQGTSISISRSAGAKPVEGSFGLAPQWSHAALSEEGKRWVSACVLGFVNAVGEHVLISMRGSNESLRATVTAEERQRFSYQEAAFYGDIFSKTPTAYVCRGNGGPVISPSRSKRLCSDPSERAGVSRCDMIITGNCVEVCAKEDSVDHSFSGCRAGGQTFNEVVTVFLQTEP
jgi:hypothetical protein